MGQYFPCSDNTFVGSVQNMSIDYGTVHPNVLGTLFDPVRRICHFVSCWLPAATYS